MTKRWNTVKVLSPTLLLAVLFLAACREYGPSLPSSVDASAMTYNIRIFSPDDIPNGDGWEERKAELVDLIERYDPDFLGLQDDLIIQHPYIRERLGKTYDFAEGFMDITRALNAIGYRKSTYRLLRMRRFWLSDTPYSSSVGWDANQERMCVYGEFEHKATGKRIHVFNTHFDHIGAEARRQSALLVVEKVKEYTCHDSAAAVIFMGDLNASFGSTLGNAVNGSLKSWLTDAKEGAPAGLVGPAGTFSGFNGINIATSRIDYIYHRNLDIQRYIHIDEKRANGRYPSDHLPVFAGFSF